MSTTHAADATFHLERRLEVTEDLFAQLNGHAPSWPSWKRGLLLLTLVGIGIALLFSPWTALLGALILLLSALHLAAPWIDRWAPRRSYRDFDYLQGSTLQGVSDTRLWFEGASLRSESTWAGLRVWAIRDGYLVLSASGMPSLYLLESDLRAAGCFDQVLALAQRFGVQYDSPEARRSVR